MREGGGGGSAWLKNFSEPQSGEENCFGFLGGPEACSPGKFLK